ncbi:something about silencing protein 10 [Aplysia californica]|uniref:Something about silencing protein 10 n=1 Tax=Aplysia californica TaxID=6500 RepID=A0ABM0JJ90_APLCA|nr:something about silencing protein 10 [Aplysia californica]XP_005094903.2 something about silencing protein 10 [Aplysia californica]
MKTKRKRNVSSKQNDRNHSGSDSNDEGNMEDIFTDEINDFTQARNKIELGAVLKDSDEEEELFALASDEDDSDEEINEWSKRLKQVKFQARLDKKKNLSDAPEKSWGQKRADFYGSGVRRKPKEAENEEEDEWLMEAREIEKLQQKMDEEMDEEDFLVTGLGQKAAKSKSGDLKVKRDLSEKYKMELQQQHYPQMEPLRAELSTCVSRVEELKDTSGWKAESQETVYRMLGAHIAFYLHLLETGQDTRGHPVLPRLLQWKKLAKVYESFPPDWLVDSEEEGPGDAEDTRGVTATGDPHSSRVRVDADSGDSEEERDDDIMEEDETAELQNRPVTYEIEKNKAKKKTAPNNPRVKHREKFRKAKIRRRGKIRDYKPELVKYRGEASGIRSGIVRSMRLK